ncbi:radical SAM protein [Candidatus Woesearchaeota archaeon]|nr:radical SAM protein [Candidatus Woesearchaeota archaeon]
MKKLKNNSQYYQKDIDIVDSEARILTGFLCNNRCIFCIEGDRPKYNRKFKAIKKNLDEAKEKSVSLISFCGGELSIHKDIFKLFEYCHKLKFEEVVIATNARMFYYDWFTDKFVDRCVYHDMKTKMVFSYHAHKSEIHDPLCSINNGFSQAITGIKKLFRKLKDEKKDKSVYGSQNLVINRFNYKYLSEIVRFTHSFGLIKHIQFINILPYESAEKSFKKLVPKINQVLPYVKEAIKDSKKIGINLYIEQMPFCLFKEYKDNISELLDGRIFSEFDIENINRSSYKFPECKECKYYLNCPGVSNTYKQYFGTSHLKKHISPYSK